LAGKNQDTTITPTLPTTCDEIVIQTAELTKGEGRAIRSEREQNSDKKAVRNCEVTEKRVHQI
jgi:hypothetical protein